MDFLSRQEAAHRASWLLRAHYLIVVVLTLPTLFLATTCVLTIVTTLAEGIIRVLPFVDDEFQFLLAPLVPLAALVTWDVEQFGRAYVWIWTTIDVLASVGLLTFCFSRMTRVNLAAYRARALHAAEAREDGPDLEERQLVNIVEEMAVASGIPAPTVYVWGETAGINAFVVGSGDGAVLFVSRGALALLDREETQALVAHEFSRILNGDAALNARMTSFNFLIFFAFAIGIGLLVMPRAGKGSFSAMVCLLIFWLICLPIALVLTVTGYLQLLATVLLQCATLRQRQKLADAYAVQFTRNPLAVRDVLMKIAVHGGMPGGSAADYQSFEHSCFASVVWRGWRDTHPPLEERLRALNVGYSREEFENFKATEIERGREIKFTVNSTPSVRLVQDAARRRRA